MGKKNQTAADRASVAGAITPEEAGTLGGLFRQRVKRTPDAISHRYYDHQSGQWRQMTWRQMAEYVARFQVAMAAEGFQVGDRSAILLPNGPEWVAADQAILGMGMVVVPLHLDHQAATLAYILENCGARMLLLRDVEAWRRLQRHVGRLAQLKRVITLRAPEEPTDARVVGLEQWLPATATRLSARDTDPQALSTIIYKPGVTRPPGVMLSHHNILWNAWACSEMNRAGAGDVALSFLPLAHSLERTVGCYQAMLQGVTVAFNRSVDRLMDDMQRVRPTVMLSVPRIFERIHAGLSEEVERRGRRWRALLDATVEVGYSRFERRQGRGSWRPGHLLWPLLDRLVARRVRMLFGGRLRYAVSSGAALSPNVARLFLGCGVDLRQGYALTEAGPMVSCNPGNANEPRSVGIRLPDVRVKMQQNGELLVSSPGVMLGYWQDPEATRKAIDETGWLRTGDKVSGLERNRIYLSGRFKQVVVMSTGEKVSPAELELALVTDPAIGQVMVLGEGRPYVAALVVLAEPERDAYLQALQLDPRDPQVHRSRALEADLLRRSRHRLDGFPRYARIRRVAVMPEPWTVENGMLTPTRKLKRRRVLAENADVVARLYAGHAGAELTDIARNVRVAG